MVKAGAFFYAIVISLITGIISSSLIFFAYFNRIEFQSATLIERVQLNSTSGINLLLAQPDQVPFEQPTEIDLFDEGTDPVSLKRLHWGAFEIAVSTGLSAKHQFTQAVLIGSNLHNESQISLYLAERNKPLSLCGRTVIKGICYLPKAGVKRAYIEGQNFIGKNLIDGEKRISENAIPKINEEMIAHNIGYFSKNFSSSDSIVDFDEIAERDTLVHPFTEKTLLIFSEGSIMLTNRHYSGNIKIVSEQSVFIGAGAELNDVIVYAPIIEIEDGFTGNLQVFANDSIVIGEKCHLKYPSVIGLIQTQNLKNTTLLIKERAKVSGVVFAYQETPDSRNRIMIVIEKNVVIRGQVYSNGMVDLKGSVYGSVTCNNFILSTPSSVYENHLLNATIDYSKLSARFVGVNLVNKSENRQVVKWLY